MLVRLFYDKVNESTNFELKEEIKVANFTIPIGTLSDGASVPKSLHRLLLSF